MYFQGRASRPALFVSLLKMSIMAVIKYGPLVEGISGKVGGVVFMKSPGQNVVRVNGRQTKVATNRRMTARVNMGIVVSLWRSIGEEARQQWDTLAASGLWDRKGKADGNVPMTGYNLCIMQNLPRLQANLELIENPSAELPEPLGMSLKEQFNEQDDLTVTVTGELDEVLDSTDKVLVWATVPYSASRNAIPGKTLRLIKVFNVSDFTESMSNPGNWTARIQNEYVAMFGVRPTVGTAFGIAVQYLKEQLLDTDHETSRSQKERPVKVTITT